MGIFDFLSGKPKRDGTCRFVVRESYLKNLVSQTRMSPMTLARLHDLGVTDSSSLKLEFFFYTNAQIKAQALTAALQEFGYDAHSEPSVDDPRIFLVNGWSTPIKMHEGTIASWTDKMCRVGFEHDAEFDGWGTSPG